jgi:hypothetical protein
MAHAYALAAELARPVARGYLTLTEAHTAMLTGTVAAERLGKLGRYKATDVYHLQQHILGLHLARLETKRAMTEAQIKRRIRPLIALRKPRNVLLAEAHDVNGAEGFPFDEPAVADIAASEVYRAVQARGARHAR